MRNIDSKSRDNLIVLRERSFSFSIADRWVRHVTRQKKSVRRFRHVELGNGDKFLIDCGSGAAERISLLQIPFDYFDKVFVGHLHTDPFGSLHDLFIGGTLMGREVPPKVLGPNGPPEELGTAQALDHMPKMLNWDIACRSGNFYPRD